MEAQRAAAGMELTVISKTSDGLSSFGEGFSSSLFSLPLGHASNPTNDTVLDFSEEEGMVK